MGLFDKFTKKKKQETKAPNGKVEFAAFIGVTNKELLALRNKEINVKALYKLLGTDITDYHRESII